MNTQFFSVKSTLIVLFILVVNCTAQAQKWNWSSTAKVKNSNNIYDIGKLGDKNIVLMSEYSIKRDFLVKKIYYSDFSWEKKNDIQFALFDKDYNFLSTIPIEFKYKVLAYYFGYINQNQIHLIYSTVQNKKCIIYADIFDQNGVYKESKLLHESAPLNIKRDEEVGAGYFTVIKSDFENTFVIDQGKLLLFFDGQLNKFWETEAATESIMNAHFTSDGKLWSIVTDKKSAYIKYSDYKTKTIVKKAIDVKNESFVDDFTLKVVPNQNIVYVACLYGKGNDKMKLTLGPRRYIAYFSQGVLFNKYDIQTLNEVESKKVAYNDKVLAAISEKKRVDDLIGLEWMSIADLHVNSLGDPIAVIQKDYYEEYQTKDQYGRVIETRYTYVYEDMVLIKPSQEEEGVQVAIKRKTKGAALYDYMLSTASFFYNDKLVVLFNEGKMSYKMMQYEFDANLNQTRMIEIPTYKEHSVYLDIKHVVVKTEKEYLIWGREGKNVACARFGF